MRRMKLVTAATDVGRIDDGWIQTEILRNGQSTHSAALTGIVDGIHIAPV